MDGKLIARSNNVSETVEIPPVEDEPTGTHHRYKLREPLSQRTNQGPCGDSRRVDRHAESTRPGGKSGGREEDHRHPVGHISTQTVPPLRLTEFRVDRID